MDKILYYVKIKKNMADPAFVSLPSPVARVLNRAYDLAPPNMVVYYTIILELPVC